MPRIIQHIDRIARIKQRAVLYLTFHVCKETSRIKREKRKYNREEFFNWNYPGEYEIYGDDYYDNKNRKIILDWLEQNNITYELCGDIASENGFRSYRGQIYLDIPYDETNEDYKKFQKFFKEEKNNTGWSKKFHAVKWLALSYEAAMKNAHHDEPGFWENWAEHF